MVGKATNDTGKVERVSRLAHTVEEAAQQIGRVAEKVQHGIERAVLKVEDRAVHIFKGRK